MAVEYSREGSVGYITLDNPPANSYDLSFMEELGESVRSAAEDEGAGAVILRSGSGGSSPPGLTRRLTPTASRRTCG